MLPEWFETIYEQTITDRAITKGLFNGMFVLLENKDFEVIDEVLAAADVTRLSPVIMAALCRLPIPAKNVLMNWVDFLRRVDAELRSRDHPEVERFMQGLTQYYMGPRLDLLCQQDDRFRNALYELSKPVPGTKGLGPKDRANRLHAELERRIAVAKEAVGMALSAETLLTLHHWKS